MNSAPPNDGKPDYSGFDELKEAGSSWLETLRGCGPWTITYTAAMAALAWIGGNAVKGDGIAAIVGAAGSVVAIAAVAGVALYMAVKHHATNSQKPPVKPP